MATNAKAKKATAKKAAPQSQSTAQEASNIIKIPVQEPKLAVGSVGSLALVQGNGRPAAVGQALVSQVATFDFDFWMRHWPDPDMLVNNKLVMRTDLRKLLTDDAIWAAIDTRRLALESTPWRLETPGTNQENPDDPNLVWLHAQIERHFDQLMQGAFESREFGYAVNELVWDIEDGRYIIKDASVKPFEWFAPRPDGTIIYCKDGGNIPWVPAKYILSRVRSTYRNPYGESMLLRLYWPWFFRCQGWSFWLQCLERFGMPFLVANVENALTTIPGTDKTVLEYVTEMLDAARRGSALAVTKDTEVKAIETTNKGDSFDLFDSKLNSRINIVILGQTLTSDVGKNGGGSRALGEVHDKVREDKKKDDCRIASKTVQTFVNYLWWMNKLPGLPPQFVMQDEAGLETARVERDGKLMPLLEKAGKRLNAAYFLERYDLNEDDLEDYEPEPVVPPQGSPLPNAQQVKKALAATGVSMDDLRRAVRGARDPSDLEDRVRLIGVDDQMVITYALASAEVLGYLEEEVEA